MVVHLIEGQASCFNADHRFITSGAVPYGTQQVQKLQYKNHGVIILHVPIELKLTAVSLQAKVQCLSQLL